MWNLSNEAADMLAGLGIHPNNDSPERLQKLCENVSRPGPNWAKKLFDVLAWSARLRDVYGVPLPSGDKIAKHFADPKRAELSEASE